MLLELTIRQFAIIDELKVNFQNGLNVLTGETGAGKSIIIDAIQLIIGGRGSTEFIRRNADKAEIEALFDLTESHPVFAALQTLGINQADEGMLLLKRELLQSGKSICRINGQLVTLAMLKEIGQWLIQLHSQHQHQQLLLQDKQLLLLDAYGEAKIYQIKEEFKQLFFQYNDLRKELNSLAKSEKELTHRLDLLQYQLKEISEAKLKPDEDIELLEQRNKIKHFEKITNTLNNTYQILLFENGVIERLGYIKNLLEQVSSFDKNLEIILDQLSSAYYQIEDVSMQIQHHLDNFNYDSEQINEIEERLAIINQFKRKYGDSVQAILEYAGTIEKEVNIIEHKDEHLRNLEKNFLEIEKNAFNKAQELSNRRIQLAKDLSFAIEQELQDLQMLKTKFEIEISRQENSYISQHGLDKINFLISPNLGEPLKPLNKIASGGEISRVMLAIQTILAQKDDIPTLIFDEIDTGISGRAAQAVAEKLSLISGDKQVFVVSHLPQVAAMADHHYLIEKIMEDEITNINIMYLNKNRRIEEIARMLGGVEVTSLTKKHAQEMIEKTKIIKA